MSQFSESKIKRDDSGRFAEKPPAPEADGVELRDSDLDDRAVVAAQRRIDRALAADDNDEIDEASLQYIAAGARRRFPTAAYAELDYDGDEGSRVITELYDSERQPVPGAAEYLDDIYVEGDDHDVNMMSCASNIRGEIGGMDSWPGEYQRVKVVDFAAVDARNPEPGSVGHFEAAAARAEKASAKVEAAKVEESRARAGLATSMLRMGGGEPSKVRFAPEKGGMLRMDAVTFADGSVRKLQDRPDYAGFHHKLLDDHGPDHGYEADIAAFD